MNRVLATCAAPLLLALAVAACGGGDGDPQAKARAKPLSIVALGDSVAVAVPECDGCTSFVDLWGDGLAKEANRPVEVSNHAVPGDKASEVLAQVKGDGATRAAIKHADLMVVALGIDDTSWKQSPRDYETTLEAILDELDTLRAGGPPHLRLTTVYDSEAVARMQCRLVEHHGGVCVDTRPAKRFLASDHIHLGPAGHKAIAELLLRTDAPKETR